MSTVQRIKVPGEKGIWKRGKRFEVAVLIGTVQGKKRYQWATVNTLREARQKRAELMTGAAKGEIAWDSKMPLSTLVEKWLEVSKVEIAPRTWENYGHIAHRHLIPTLGHCRLRDLKSDTVQDYITAKMKGGRLDGEAGGLSAKTITHHYIVL
jgi:hypothetical protein